MQSTPDLPQPSRPAALWLTVAAVRCQYSIGHTTIYRLIKNGRIVAKKVGTRTLLSRESLDALMEQAPAVGAR